MSIYDQLIIKKAGIIPISKYPEFYEKFSTYLKANNPHVVFSNHRVTCAKCGFHFTKKAIMQLNLAELRGMPGYGGKQLNIKKCVKCGYPKIKIVIEKLERTPLKGKFTTVFVCGQVGKQTSNFQRIETKFVKWLKAKKLAHLSPDVVISTLHFGKVPDSHNRKLIDAFVQKLLKDKGMGHRDYQVKAYKQSGHNFLVVFM